MSAAHRPRATERPRAYGDSWKFEPSEKLDAYQREMKENGVLFPSSKEEPLPRPKDKVPVFPVWRQHLWLFPRAAAPVVIRYLFMKLTGWTIHPVFMFTLMIMNNAFVYQSFYYMLHVFLRYHGYLDGEMERDSATPGMAKRVITEFRQAMLIRPLMVLALAYDQTALPSLSLWLPVQLCVFTMLVDFFYYWVHRATHDSDLLWNYHSLHHTTKYPTAYMLGFADEPQEVFDLIGSPILAYMLFPLNFDALYIWSVYFATVEMTGHSGLRIYYPMPLTGLFLRLFKCELVLEDHDLHHRFGWRDSSNYGKQCLFWDTLFGTSGQRMETHDANVDWSRTVA